MDKFLLNIINEILEEKGKAKIDIIDVNTSLRKDLKFDSMDLALLTAKLDEEFEIDIFEDGIVDSVGEVLKKLDN